MKYELRKQKVEESIHNSLKNLFRGQVDFKFDGFAVTVLEGLMLLEREEYMKSQTEDSKTIANGVYLRNFKSLSRNSLQVQIPRTRNGKFKPVVMTLINNQKEQMNELALLLYRKGLSSRDVSSLMSEYFGESMSRDTVNNLAESFHEIRKSWESRQLKSYYKAVFCDAMYVSVKRGDSYSREAVYVIYGVTDQNKRELLLLEVNPTEGSTTWGDYIGKLKQKGVESIDLFVADGLVGFAEAAKNHYPLCDVQRCVVHLQRGILSKIRPKDKPEFAEDLREAFNNFESTSTLDEAKNKLKKLHEKWEKSYKKVTQKLLEEQVILDYLTYIKYPTKVRRMIYTTNSIENLNRQIRKITKTKVTFDKEENMLDLIFMVIKDFKRMNWQLYPVTNYAAWPSKKHT